VDHPRAGGERVKGEMATQNTLLERRDTDDAEADAEEPADDLDERCLSEEGGIRTAP